MEVRKVAFGVHNVSQCCGVLERLRTQVKPRDLHQHLLGEVLMVMTHMEYKRPVD